MQLDNTHAATIALLLSAALPLTPLPAQDTPPPADAPADATQEAELSEEEMEKKFMELVESFGWMREGTGDVGTWAKLEIPEGYRFTPTAGARKLMELYGNTLTEREQGLIAPENLDWFAIFEFNEVGYIKDDDKDELDPDGLLESYRQGAKQESEMRGQDIQVVGWAMPPTYNEVTNNLEWGVEYSIDGHPVVNYQTHLLGRHGEMEVTLVCDPSQLDTLMPKYQDLLAGYAYQEGKSYAEFVKGDKIAEYGLAGLVAGGSLFAAAKMGLFAKLGMMLGKAWKLVVVGIIAVIAAFKGFFARLFGKEG